MQSVACDNPHCPLFNRSLAANLQQASSGNVVTLLLSLLWLAYPGLVSLLFCILLHLPHMKIYCHGHCACCLSSATWLCGHRLLQLQLGCLLEHYHDIMTRWLHCAVCYATHFVEMLHIYWHQSWNVSRLITSNVGPSWSRTWTSTGFSSAVWCR